MQAVTTIGLDIAKSVFQAHGIGADTSQRIATKIEMGDYSRAEHSGKRATAEALNVQIGGTSVES